MANSDTPLQNERLNRAISDYLVRSETGEVIDCGEILAKHPDVADQLSTFFDDLNFVKDALADSSDIDANDTVLENVDSGVAVPCVFGHFELLERLGSGATGTVWRAHDSKLDRVVAIKIPRDRDLTVEETERFLREARVAAQLRHPHIAAVFDVGHTDDIVYIVSDYVAGVTLSHWRKEQSPSPAESAIMCAKIADGLEHAHQAQVVHRDIKPSNIMVDAEGEPRIVDFGLAKRNAGELTMTAQGHVAGTPAYMSPEQASGATDEVDHRTDVYSLGVVLFELLTDQRPFTGNIGQVAHQLVHEDAPRARSIRDDVPRDLDTICVKCLEKRPTDRYDTASELRDDLHRFVRGEPIRARLVSTPGRLWRWCGRNRVVATLGALLLVALVTGIAAVSGQAVKRQLAQDGRDQAVINSLLVADTDAARDAIELVQSRGTDLHSRLHLLLAGSDLSQRQRVRIQLVLLPNEPEHISDLRSVLPFLNIAEILLVRDVLVLHRDELSGELWGIALNESNPALQRLRAAAVLAAWEPNHTQWPAVAPFIAAHATAQSRDVRTHWIDAFHPVGRHLIEPLIEIYNTERHAVAVAMALARYAGDRPGLLVDLATAARPDQLRVICDALVPHADVVESRLIRIVNQPPLPIDSKELLASQAHRQANAGVALLRLGRSEYVLKHLEFSPDPQRRSLTIHRIAASGCPGHVAADLLSKSSDATVRAGVLQCLGEYQYTTASLAGRREIVSAVVQIYRNTDDPSLHASAAWLLRKWGFEDRVDDADRDAAKRLDAGRWHVNGQGQTMILVTGSATFTMGTPDEERGHENDENQHSADIDHSFWISGYEVTVGQFEQFMATPLGGHAEADVSVKQPVRGVSWYEAAAYCNWLSDGEGIAENQRCYLPNDQGNYASGMSIAPDWPNRAGYRLPTETEWEFSCRANTTTAGYQGRGRTLLRSYAWCDRDEPSSLPRPIGLKKPNHFGLSDMLGNVSEWCHDAYGPYQIDDFTSRQLPQQQSADEPPESTVRDGEPRVYRGGSHRDRLLNIRCGNRAHSPPEARPPSVGFRIVHRVE